MPLKVKLGYAGRPTGADAVLPPPLDDSSRARQISLQVDLQTTAGRGRRSLFSARDTE
jgi:hypothetical protein